MTTYQGAEARYASRFSKIRQQSGESLKKIDSAKNVTEHLTQARASLKAQEKNTQELFSTARELVSGVDTFQQMLGHSFVRNMPLPTPEIIDSPSKQLGYVQLSLRFFQAGVIHFMEEMGDAQDRIDQLEKLVSSISEYDSEDVLLGEMQSLDLDKIGEESNKPSPVVTSKVDDVATPPPTPTKKADPVPGKTTKEQDSKKNQKKK